VTMVRC